MAGLGQVTLYRLHGIIYIYYRVVVLRSKNEPTTVAKITAAATQKLQCWKFGLPQRYAMLHTVAQDL